MRLLYVRIPDFEDIPGGGGNISYLQLIENEAAARIAGDDEINQQLDIIIDGLADFENEINAELATVQTLAETNQLNISTKTDQADFDSLAEIVTDNGLVLAQKASQTDLDALTTEVSTKATPADISAAIAALVDGAPASLDTLAEIAAELAGDAASINDLLTQINNRVRFDAAQSLTTAQQLQARQNINAEAAGVAAALVAAITAASIGAATAAQGAKADSALQSGDVAPVALSGSYTALTDKPTIVNPVNADWNSASGLSQILNKPNLFGLSSLLTGLGAGSNTVITAADSLINALANLQAQIAANWLTTLDNYTVPRVGTAYVSGLWYDVTHRRHYALTGSASLTVGVIYAIPFVAHGTISINNIGGYVTAVATNAKVVFGIAAANSNGEPGLVLAKTSQLDASGAVGAKNEAITASISNGNVYFLLALNLTAAIQIAGLPATAAVSILGSSAIATASPWQYQYSGQTDIPADLTGVSKIAPSSNSSFPRVCFKAA